MDTTSNDSAGEKSAAEINHGAAGAAAKMFEDAWLAADLPRSPVALAMLRRGLIGVVREHGRLGAIDYVEALLRMLREAEADDESHDAASG